MKAKNIAKLEELANLVGELSSSWQKLNDGWLGNSSSAIDFILEGKYPFEICFNKLSYKVAEWHEDLKSEVLRLKKEDYKKTLDGMYDEKRCEEEQKQIVMTPSLKKQHKEKDGTLTPYQVYDIVKKAEVALKECFGLEFFDVENIEVVGTKLILDVVVNNGKTPAIEFTYDLEDDDVQLIRRDMPRDMFDKFTW